MISPKDLELLEQALPQMSEAERQRNLKLLQDYKKELVKQAGSIAGAPLMDPSKNPDTKKDFQDLMGGLGQQPPEQ